MEKAQTETDIAKTGNGETSLDHQTWNDLDGGVLLETGEERVYYHAAEGNICSGLLVDTESYMDPEDRLVTYFVFLTDRDCEVQSGDIDDPFVVPPGSLVHVNERHQLKKLHKLLRSPKYYRVAIQAMTKRKIKGSPNTVWAFRIACKPTNKERSVPQASQAPGDAPRDNSDIPF